MKIDESESVQQEEPSGVNSFISGILLGIIPSVLVAGFWSSTVVIAKSPLASWLVDGWVLAGTLFLFFRSKKLTPNTRLVVEATLVMAALALFVTKIFLTGVPGANSSESHQFDWGRALFVGLVIGLSAVVYWLLTRKKKRD